MKIIVFVLSLMLTSVAYSEPGTVLRKESKVIELIEKEGGSKIGTIHVNDQSVLLEANLPNVS